jgi:hypothetical protein
MQEFDRDFTRMAGHNNIAADGLSRCCAHLGKDKEQRLYDLRADM